MLLEMQQAGKEKRDSLVYPQAHLTNLVFRFDRFEYNLSFVWSFDYLMFACIFDSNRVHSLQGRWEMGQICCQIKFPSQATTQKVWFWFKFLFDKGKAVQMRQWILVMKPEWGVWMSDFECIHFAMENKLIFQLLPESSVGQGMETKLINLSAFILLINQPKKMGIKMGTDISF